jgi:hypothetical protein
MTQGRFADANLDRLVDLTLRALTEPLAPVEGGVPQGGIPDQPSAPPPDPTANEGPSLDAEPVQALDDVTMAQLCDYVSTALRGLDSPKPVGGRQISPEQSGIPRNPMLQPPTDHALDIRR